MKKIAFALMIIFALSGCDSIPDGVVDVETADYQIGEVNAPSTFIRTDKNTAINHSILIKNSESVAEVNYKLVTYRGEVLKSEKMSFDGDISVHNKDYYAETPMSPEDYTGYYEFRYYVTDNLGNNAENTKEVVVHKFYYNNGQDNEPPVVSNHQVYYYNDEPGLINVATTDRYIVLSVEAMDPNGSSDLKSVYYQLYNPDGNRVSNSQGRYDFPLFDDGDTENTGDITAGDGRYTVLIRFPAGQPLGQWKFEFAAKDQLGEVSNKIEHNLVLE